MADKRTGNKEIYWTVLTFAGVFLFWTAYVFIVFKSLPFPETGFGQLWWDMIKQEEALYVMIASVASVYAVRFMVTTVRLRKKLEKLSAQ